MSICHLKGFFVVVVVSTALVTTARDPESWDLISLNHVVGLLGSDFQLHSH